MSPNYASPCSQQQVVNQAIACPHAHREIPSITQFHVNVHHREIPLLWFQQMWCGRKSCLQKAMASRAYATCSANFCHLVGCWLFLCHLPTETAGHGEHMGLT